tara:strand:- start:593 stop:856 length:264 start_codon:yes stop_codon:yes gene_type:complete
MPTIHPSELYSPSDWAELFILCTKATETGNNDEVHKWLVDYSNAHGLAHPEETHDWSDTKYIVKETLMFLDKFAENWTDELESRKRR